jgi:hypothetical protein
MDQGLDGIKNDIQEIRRTLAENTLMLASIQRRARLSITFSTLKWIVLIGLSFGAFYFVRPYMETALGAYGSIKDMFIPK